MKEKNRLSKRLFSIVLCLILMLTFVPMTAFAADNAETPNIWVGGVQITADNAGDVFGDGKVSYDTATSTLTLKGYNYEGQGYLYDSSVDSEGKEEEYRAVIYSDGSINIKIEGTCELKNSVNNSDKEVFVDGIVAEGSVTITGNGLLSISGSYAIDADQDITIDGSTLYLKTTDECVSTINGSLIIKNNVEVTVVSDSDGIYVYKDVTITDSIVNINAQGDGIYSYDGSVAINSTKVGINDNPLLGFWCCML